MVLYYHTFVVFSPLCEQLCLSAEGGVVVDNEMRSNLPDVYAAGDVCSANWDHSQLWFQVRSLYRVLKVPVPGVDGSVGTCMMERVDVICSWRGRGVSYVSVLHVYAM